jgi:predicted amidohydrolase
MVIVCLGHGRISYGYQKTWIYDLGTWASGLRWCPGHETDLVYLTQFKSYSS